MLHTVNFARNSTIPKEYFKKVLRTKNFQAIDFAFLRNPLNPLTTDDAFWRCLTLAACYQLAQSVLKIGFALAKKSGIGGGGWVSVRGAIHPAAALAD